MSRHHPLIRAQTLHKQIQQRRLPPAIEPDDADAVAEVDGESYVLEDQRGGGGVAVGDVFEGDEVAGEAEVGGGGEGEGDALFVFGDFDGGVFAVEPACVRSVVLFFIRKIKGYRGILWPLFVICKERGIRSSHPSDQTA
jgi:hypothetical protein